LIKVEMTADVRSYLGKHSHNFYVQERNCVCFWSY